MAEYIEREKAQDGLDNIDWYHVNGEGQLLHGGKSDIETYVPFKAVEEMLKSIPAADVLPRDEAIKMGAELAAMHGSDATSQQLEEAYLKGVEDGMTRRDVRPVVVCANCEHNNHCLTQEFVDDCGKIPLDRNTFFCADGERRSNA